MKFTRTVLAVSCLTAAVAQADQGLFDVRTAYMGGAGVAGQRADAGIPLNPANMALPLGKEKWGLTVPVINGGYSDPGNLSGDINSIQNDYLDKMDNDINKLQGANSAELSDPNGPYKANMQELGSVSGKLSSTLQSASNSQVLVNAGLGTGLVVPGKDLAVGVDLKASADIVGQPHASAQDLDLLGKMQKVFSKGYVTAIDKIQYPQLFSAGLTPSNYGSTSTATLVALVQSEVGVSLAHQFPLAGPDQALALGVTPKILQLRTYDYTQVLSSSNGFSTSDLKHFTTSSSMLNADIGATYEANANWRSALLVNNVISKTMTTFTGRKISLEPKVTGGLAYRSSRFNWSLDVDLTKQTELGFNSDSQIVATGVEYNAGNMLRCGVGFRHNLIDSAVRDAATVGFSSNLFGFNSGLALQGNHSGLSGAFQISLEY